MSLHLSRSEALDRIVKLYKPNVGHGNFRADVHWRGGNDKLIDVAVALDLATREDLVARFREIDREAWAESEARLQQINARNAS